MEGVKTTLSLNTLAKAGQRGLEVLSKTNQIPNVMFAEIAELEPLTLRLSVKAHNHNHMVTTYPMYVD